MATVASLQAQLQTASTFLAAQRRTLSQVDLNNHMEAMARSLHAQISNTVIDYNDATTLTQHIRASAFSDSIKDMFTTAVAERALHTTAVHGSAHARTQVLLYPLNYFTRTEWGLFNDQTRSQTHHVAVAGHRFKLLKVKNPSEQTLRNLAALIALMIWPGVDPPPQATLALVAELKAYIRLSPVEGGPRVDHYPPDPSNLPRALYTHAYTTEPPVRVTLSRYHEMCTRVVLRTSHNSVRNSSGGGSVQALLGLLAGQTTSPSQMRLALGDVMRSSPPQGSGQRQPSEGQLTLLDIQPNLALTTEPSAPATDRDAASASLRRRLFNKQPSSIVKAQTGAPTAAADDGDPSIESMENMARSVYAKKAGSKQKASKSKQTESKVTKVMKGKLKVMKGNLKKGQKSKQEKPIKKQEQDTKTDQGKKDKRPPVPAPRMGTTIFYNDGKINISKLKRGYRVFRLKTDRVDKLVRWDNFPCRRDAWNAALDIIDE